MERELRVMSYFVYLFSVIFGLMLKLCSLPGASSIDLFLRSFLMYMVRLLVIDSLSERGLSAALVSCVTACYFLAILAMFIIYAYQSLYETSNICRAVLRGMVWGGFI